MAKVAKRDEDETNTDICFDDIFYLSEVGNVHSKVTNDQKNLHGGYDSGVDSISCKSNASSSSHSDILEDKAPLLIRILVVGNPRYFCRNVTCQRTK